MNTRSVVTSAPVVAGFALLALVLGAIFGVRSAMNNDDGGDTGVAGVVIERSEVPTIAPVEPAPQPRITRPARTEPATEAPVVDEPEVVIAPQPEPEAPPVGLIRDETPTNTDTDPEPQPRQDPEPREPREPRPQPEPEPTREPRPEPEPEPEPDTSRFEMTCPTDSPDRCAGLTRDAVYSEQLGESGKYDWTFRDFAGHHTGDPRSRQTQARLSVGFNESAKRSKEPVRDFRCDAVLTAGSRRLITDGNYVFEIQLYTSSDGYTPDEPVGSPVIVNRAFDLQAGESRRMVSNTYQLDAEANAGEYMCSVVYRSR